MHATWIATPGESDTETTIFGITFPRGEPVDVSDCPSDIKARLRRHAHFELSGEGSEPVVKAPRAPRKAPVRRRKAAE